MYYLFRHKIVSVVKYFSTFGSHEKITKGENATVGGILQSPVAVTGFRQQCLAGFRLDSSESDQIRSDQWPNPSHFG